MIAWDFVLNDAPMSSLSTGKLKFNAFSGLGAYVNSTSSVCLADQGPLPPGRYYIVDRPTGGMLGAARDWWSGKDIWFALYADDDAIDDYAFCEKVRRGNFRLHPKGLAGISKGCITLEKREDFMNVRTLILGATKSVIPGSGVETYGTVDVASRPAR